MEEDLFPHHYPKVSEADVARYRAETEAIAGYQRISRWAFGIAAVGGLVALLIRSFF
jgi:hypothetical protein